MSMRPESHSQQLHASAKYLRVDKDWLLINKGEALLQVVRQISD